MTDYLAVAVGALRGERVNRTFETIEDMAFAALGDGKTLVIIVPADFTTRHKCFLLPARANVVLAVCRAFAQIPKVGHRNSDDNKSKRGE